MCKSYIKTQIFILFIGFPSLITAQNKAFYESKAFNIYPDKVVQGDFTGLALSTIALESNYRSPKVGRNSPSILNDKQSDKKTFARSLMGN